MSSATAPLDVVVPAHEHLAPDPAERRLVTLYDQATGPDGRHRPHVRANMISTVDGGAWGPDHLSGSINDAADWRVFRVLRALADVVLVGAGTARAEGYTALARPAGIADRAGGAQAPLELALVSRSGRVPPALADGDRPPFVVTGAAGAQVAADTLPRDRVIAVPGRGDPEQVDLAAGVAELAARGLAGVLCEGGPHLLDGMLHAGLVDELCVTTSPGLVGPGPGRIVAGAVTGAPASAPRPARLAHLLHAPATGTLLARWVLRTAGE